MMMRVCASIFACVAFLAAAAPIGFAPPTKAIALIAESVDEGCAVCVDDLRKKAFADLAKAFAPGTMVKVQGGCVFVKPKGSTANDLAPACYAPGANEPRIVFRFYTKGRRLAGIDAGDFTDRQIERTYARAPKSVRFDATVRIIPYKYGDGPAFNYFAKENSIVIHCAVVELKAAGR
ncbi:MAG TPA: hypothetical protein PLG31_16730 [Spirochaetota bacterium]|nr:hypothetical protein [Spirochaetota bacterium]